jgi:hypothetical protein
MGLKKDFVGGWEDKMDFFLKKSENYCDVEKKYCQSNIDIDRADMPQIYEEYIPQYVDFLEEQGIDSNMDYDVKVGSLHPTQKNISLPRMKRMLHRLLEGYYTDTEGKKLNPLKRVIVVTKDGYVLDGHHRWATSLFLSPNNTVDVLRVNANIKDLVPISKNFGMVEFQKFMFGGVLEENKPLKVTGGRFPKTGIVFHTLVRGGEEIGFYTQVGKRNLDNKMFPYIRLEKLTKALEVNYPDIKLVIAVDKASKDEYFKDAALKHANLLFISIDSGKSYESIDFRGGVDVRQKYFQDPSFLDAVLELLSAFFFPGTGMYMPITYGKRKRAVRKKIDPNNVKVQALSPGVTYRFKTEQEFINEFGSDWRKKTDWSGPSPTGMDVLFGQIIDRQYNSKIDKDIRRSSRSELSKYGIVGTNTSWNINYKMLTYNIPITQVPASTTQPTTPPTRTQFTVPDSTPKPQQSDDFKVGDIVRIRETAYERYKDIRDRYQLNGNIWVIDRINSDSVKLISEQGGIEYAVLYNDNLSEAIEKGNPTLTKLDDTKDYRIKTEEEFIKDFGDDWRDEYDWSPYGTVIDSKDQLFGKVFKVGSANSQEELEANKDFLGRVFRVYRSGFTPNPLMNTMGIPDWYYKKEYFVEIEPQAQTLTSSIQSPIATSLTTQTQEALDEKIQAIQVLMDSFTEDEIEVRRFLLNQIKELRLEKEQLMQALYFNGDMGNLLGLYLSKLSMGQRIISAPNGCGLDTPSGKPSQLDYEQHKLVRTPEFKNWFGDWELAYQTKNYNDVSKAINEETGEPMVMYHGKANMQVEATYFNLKNFPIKYFAKNYSYSKWFAEQGQGIKVLYEFFVKVVNPIDFSKVALDNITPNIFKLLVSSLYGYEIKTQLMREDVPQKVWCILRGNPGMLREIRDNTNFDGFILYENNPDDYEGQKPNYNSPCLDEFSGLENTTLDFCTFNNTQQKAADGRNTTFFNDVEDVRFGKGGVINN